MRSIRFSKQHDSMQCGVSCLQMVCSAYGKYFSLEKLDSLCHATTQGVSLLGISKTAEELGFNTFCAKSSVSSLKEGIFPCIIHWHQNHFIVLYKINRQGTKFYIADPAKGKVVYNKEEFTAGWGITEENGETKGITLFLQPTENFFNQKECKREKHDYIPFILQYLKPFKKHFIVIAIGLILGCVFQFTMPFLTKSIVDNGIKNKNLSIIWLIMIGELLIVCGSAITDFIRRWLVMRISMNINISLIGDFFIKLLKLPMAFFDTKLLGDLLQRIGDHERIQTFLTGQILGMLFSVMTFIVLGSVLFIYNSTIFLIFLCGSIIYGIWVMLFLKRRRVLNYEIFEAKAINQNKTYQFINSIQEIKLQDCEKRRCNEWKDTQQKLFETQFKGLRLQQGQEGGSIFINEIKNILITVFAATSVVNGDISLGTMMSIQYMVGQLNSPVEQFMSFVYSIQDVKISLERIYEVHQGKIEDNSLRNIKSFDSETTIDFRNVTFKYDPNALSKTLDDLTLKIPEGKVTAIVGASGSGKTTMIKLMLGYYQPNNGSILVANKNLNQFNLKWWRNQCGVVMQDGIIFSESIARNIAISDDEINYDKLRKAAEIACIKDYIEQLPLKYETIIGKDGVGLSQGQKQRILIARAVYKDPSFIFLDEATNSLDATNERTIVGNLNQFFKGRTVVIVAHRLSTVRDADQIIVLENGSIKETGNHESLSKRKGTYFNLIKNQLELGT
ncbi:MAG: peptidase domain-containing ABC transporter [Muribaculaceae bacterium]|nr:peptidase domain-containing ABC transporter [Muribaculaceae bacterium]